MTPAGLKWYKLDLHVHTPASTDYSGPGLSPKDFVQAAIDRGVAGIGVTDHNSAGWVDALTAAADGTPLAIFPGVEISCNAGKSGIHLIALFERREPASTVVSLLSKVGIDPAQHGKMEALTKGSVRDVAETIESMGGVAILAHADSTKGALADLSGQPRVDVVRCSSVSAVELCQPEKSARYLDGNDKHYQRHLPYYRASDNPNPTGAGGHSVEGIGQRYSWFHLDGLSLASLRQCLIDPEVRILTDLQEHLLPKNTHPRIVSASVSGGFFRDQEFHFHPGLNSIIGGKGVGKSLLIEFLRFALNQASNIPDLYEDMCGKLAACLGIGGVVKVCIALPHGRILMVRREYDDRDNPLHVTDLETGKDIKAMVEELFPVLVYSQTEALAIAKSDVAQLALIDSFIEGSAVMQRIDALRNELRTSGDLLLQTMTAVADEEQAQLRCHTLTERMKQIDAALKSSKHDEMTALGPKTEYLNELAATAATLDELVSPFLGELENIDVQEPAGALRADMALAGARKSLTQLLARLQSSANKMAADLAKVTPVLDALGTAWAKTVATKNEEYRKWTETQGGDKARLAATRRTLQADLVGAQRLLKAVSKKAEGLPALKAKRGALLSKLDESAAHLAGLRRTKYSEISANSGGRLQLELVEGGDRKPYHEAVVSLKRGTKLRDSTIAAVTDAVAPRRLAALVLSNDAKALASEAELQVSQAQALLDHLRGFGDQTEILCLEYDDLVRDVPRLLYQKDDGNHYELTTLSVGQKCTALLLIALLEGDRPVIVDQPEDALDIPSIFADITSALRGGKGRRQFIVTTHNPTVAVAGDSDQFQVLRATAAQGTLAIVGALDRDNVRDAVLQHLEGGKKPYSLKSRKYGLRPHDRP